MFGKGTIGGLFRRAVGARAGYYYDDPQFVQQERMLRRRVGENIGQMTQDLVARGYSPDEARRKLMRATIGAQGQFAELGAQQAEIVRRREEERRERRRNRRRIIPGMLLSLGTQFGGMAFGSALRRREQREAADLGLTGYGYGQPYRPYNIYSVRQI